MEADGGVKGRRGRGQESSIMDGGGVEEGRGFSESDKWERESGESERRQKRCLLMDNKRAEGAGRMEMSLKRGR